MIQDVKYQNQPQLNLKQSCENKINSPVLNFKEQSQLNQSYLDNKCIKYQFNQIKLQSIQHLNGKTEYKNSSNISTVLQNDKIFAIKFCCEACKTVIKFDKVEIDQGKIQEYKKKHLQLCKNKLKKNILKKQRKLITNCLMQPEFQWVQDERLDPFFIKQLKDNLKKCNFKNLKQCLEYYSYEFRYQFNQNDIKKEELPDTLIAISLRDKQNYRRFGQFISFDITYNCVKEVSVVHKTYGIGIFSGFDCNNRMLIFGFSLNTNQTKNDFKKIFTWFFDIMGFTHTTSIITDQQKSLTNALQELKEEKKYKYHLIYDNWHFIRSFRTGLKRIQKKTLGSMIKILSKTMKESDPAIGNHWLLMLNTMMKQNNLQNEYNNLLDKLDHVCVWRFPKQFVGLSKHSNEQMNHLLKLKIENESNIIKIIEGINEISKERSEFSLRKRQYQQYPFENFYEDQSIKQIRQNFQKKIFNAFIFNYKRSQFYKVLTYDSLKLHYRILHIIDHQQYHIFNYQCSCAASQKLGIPCQHLIYITRQLRPEDGYLKLFNQRWLSSRIEKNRRKRKIR